MSKLADKSTVISISTGTIFKILIIAVAIGFLWYVKEIVIMLVLAVLLAALIEPHFPEAREAANNLRRLILARSRSIAEQLQRPEPALVNPGGNVAR